MENRTKSIVSVGLLALLTIAPATRCMDQGGGGAETPSAKRQKTTDATKGIDKDAALRAATLNGDIETVRQLLNDGANPNTIDTGDDSWPLLMRVALLGNTEMAELFLESGAQADAANNQKITALMIAAEKGDTSLVKILLERDANVNAECDDGSTAILNAAHNGHTQTIQLLLDYNAFVDATNDDDKVTPLMKAIEDHDMSAIQLLLDYKASIHAVDSGGRTPLMYAAHYDMENDDTDDESDDDDLDEPTAIAEFLLNRNAQVDVKDNKGWTALMYASASGRKQLVELLLDRGANPDTLSNRLATALTLAQSHQSIQNLLVDRGALTELPRLIARSNQVRINRGQMIESTLNQYRTVPAISQLINEYVS